MLSAKFLLTNHGISVEEGVKIDSATINGKVVRSGKQFDRHYDLAASVVLHTQCGKSITIRE